MWHNGDDDGKNLDETKDDDDVEDAGEDMNKDNDDVEDDGEDMNG